MVAVSGVHTWMPMQLRWETNVEQGTILHPEKEFEFDDIWQVYHLAADEPYILKQVYWSDCELRNSENVFIDGDLRPELHTWDEEVKLEIDIRRLVRYPTVWLTPASDGDNGLRYTVWARLRVKICGLQVTITWDIARPGFRTGTLSVV